MKHILILGAGRSASTLIRYLLEEGSKHDWQITLGDINLPLAQQKVEGFSNGKAINFNVFEEKQCEEEVQKADIVISMLPARFHFNVAKACVKFSKNMVTASYISPEIKELDQAAKEKNILILNEIGLDPGLDHLSAKEIIDNLQERGADITAFKSFTGGLVAPESDNNPWHYKFTWNPRNVVLAGQSTAKFIHNQRYKYVPYQRLFSYLHPLNFDDLGEFEGYPNRDSLAYRETYNLQNIPTMLRGTIRKKGYSRMWDTFVQLGITDDSFKLTNIKTFTYRDFVNAFLKYSVKDSVEQKLADLMGFAIDGEEMQAIKWLGILDNTKIPMSEGTPAQILQSILEKKWTLEENDKDMIIMQHHFKYKLDGQAKHLISSMVVYGDDTEHTAMSKTVGYPLAIATKLILTGKIKIKGVHIPTKATIYEPILKELEGLNIKFTEKTKDITDEFLYE